MFKWIKSFFRMYYIWLEGKPKEYKVVKSWFAKCFVEVWLGLKNWYDFFRGRDKIRRVTSCNMASIIHFGNTTEIERQWDRIVEMGKQYLKEKEETKRRQKEQYANDRWKSAR